MLLFWVQEWERKALRLRESVANTLPALLFVRQAPDPRQSCGDSAGGSDKPPRTRRRQNSEGPSFPLQSVQPWSQGRGADSPASSFPASSAWPQTWKAICRRNPKLLRTQLAWEKTTAHAKTQMIKIRQSSYYTDSIWRRWGILHFPSWERHAGWNKVPFLRKTPALAQVWMFYCLLCPLRLYVLCFLSHTIHICIFKWYKSESNYKVPWILLWKWKFNKQ